MKAIAVGIAALLILICTLVAASRDRVTTSSRDQAEAAAVGILTQTVALKRLRAGDASGAIAILETTLNANLLILEGNLEVQRSPKVKSILETAAEYRERYPHRSEQELDAQVSRFLNQYRRPAE